MEFVISAFSDEASASLSGQIEALKRNRLAGMEIRAIDGENISAISRQKAGQIRAALDEQGLSVWSVGSPIGKISVLDPFEPHVELFRRTLENAALLGAENIRIFSFYIPKEGALTAFRDEVLARLARLLELARPYGFTLCHENEKGIYGQSAECCLEIAQALPDIRLVYDPANFIQAGQDALAAWRLVKGHVKYLHIKDARPDGRVVPAGAGAGHIAEILSEYSALGGRHVTLEPHLTVFEGFAALEREADAASKLGAYEYASAHAAFDAAVQALRQTIQAIDH